jgi:hypothetical protein
VPIQGFVRLRKHQFGRQADFGTKVPATRAYPLSGTPSVELNWTDPDADQGSRDPVAPPYRGAPDLTADLTDNSLAYNNLPIIMAAFFGGDEVPTGGGTAQTWTHLPASLTAEQPDPFTYEFGDDVLTDWYQFGDCILESWEITGPEGLGVLTASQTWRLGSVSSTGSTDSPVTGTVPTPALSVDPTAVLVYLKDMSLYIADDPDDLFAPGSKVSDALHTFVMRGTQEIDQKRFANGTQTFDISAYGPGTRGLEFEGTYAKTADTVGLLSESDKWLSDQAVNRYIGLDFVCTVLAESPSTFYSWRVIMPARYYTREEGDIGGNTTVILNAHAFYDPTDFEGVFSSVVVNTLTEAVLGEAGS